MNTRKMTIDAYLDVFGSSAPVPGGGGANAVVGALACSACLMVCSLTIGKKKYAEVEDEVKAIARRMEEAREEFLGLADADARAFEPLSQAYKDKETPDDVMDELYETAASVPLRVTELALSLLKDIRYMEENGSVLAVSDAQCAANMMESVIKNGEITAQCNSRYIKNHKKAEAIDTKVEQFLAEYRHFLIK